MISNDDKQPKIIPVILCGGVGTRLWPLSRERAPKQFHSIVGELPLLQETLKRALECSDAPASDIITVTSDALKRETIHLLADFDPDSITHLISEPMGCNTAPAIAYAALYAEKHFGPEVMLWIIPSDHHVEDTHGLSQALKNAAKISQDGYITTFGMSPTRPDTGYGYIKMGKNIASSSAQEIEIFKEKPNKETAQSYLDNGKYLWNSGMFMSSVQTLLNNYKEHCPEILEPLKSDFKTKNKISNETYQSLPKLPFDTAIMEKTTRAAVIPCDIGWSDIGSWESVWDIKDKDQNGNATEGRVTLVDSKNCLIQSNNLLIAAMGLEDIVIIENGDSVLIADKKNNSAMKTLVASLNKMNCKETIDPPIENRPWGTFKVLTERDGYKVKEINVKAGQKLSLQMHHHRCEFWTVVSGEATITINDEKRTLQAQESAFIPLKATHRIENLSTEDLTIVEVQCGDYLGEDDIVRFDDIYGRTATA